MCGMARGIGREAPPPQRARDTRQCFKDRGDVFDVPRRSSRPQSEVMFWGACQFATGGIQRRALRGFGELGVGRPQPVGEEHRLHLRKDVPRTARGYHLMYMGFSCAEVTMVGNTAESFFGDQSKGAGGGHGFSENINRII